MSKLLLVQPYENIEEIKENLINAVPTTLLWLASNVKHKRTVKIFIK